MFSRSILSRPVRVLFLFAILPVVPAWSAPPSEADFRHYDRNGDEVVDERELPDREVRARFDRDGDGRVDLGEFRETVEREKENLPQEGPADGQSDRSDAVSRFDALIRSIDRDGDGAISSAEAGDAPWFTRVDRDGDGSIGAREIERVRRFVERVGEVAVPSPPGVEMDAEEVAEVTSGPEVLKPGDVGIGRMVPDAAFTDLAGEERTIASSLGENGLVVAMTSATCPVSKRFLPDLVELERNLAGRGLNLILVNAFASESEREIREQLASFEPSPAYVRDVDLSLSRALEAATTTEVFLIDEKRTLVYRGALNDQYGVDYSVSEPRHHYLVDAAEALLRSEVPAIEATAAPGCEIDLKLRETTADPEAVDAAITYHRDVARILQRNCVRCHYDGGIAPFALDDWEEVSDRSRVIRRVVTEGTMPPWFAAPPEDGGPSPWSNDHSLSERDKADLLAWLDSTDQPLGDPEDAPAPLSFPDEWTIGEPDLVVPLSRPYEIQATGFMPYQHDRVELELEESRWVQAYEILPSERDVVHHVIVQVFEPGQKVRRSAEGSTGYWAVYVPGNGSHVFPEGFAKQLPAGATIQFQIHYTPSGEAKRERLRLGLVFADETPKYEVRTLPLADRKLEIPPGAKSHVEGISRRAPFDIPVTSFMPHMHTRGAAFRYEVTYPDGEHEVLLDIPRYDFNWQLRYDLREPKLIPRGSEVRVTGVFDNSAENRANPDPTKTVRWGDQTVDEMLIGYIEYFLPIEDDSVADAGGR